MRAGPTDLFAALQRNAETSPQKVAFYVLDSLLNEQEKITYEALVQRVERRAATLHAKGLSRHRAVLFQPTGLDFIVNFFAVLATGGAVVPLPSKQLVGDDGHLEAILRNAAPVVLIGDRPTAARLARVKPDSEWRIEVLEGEAADIETDAPWPRAVEPDRLALVQYTSGSTSAPKGVCLTHANLLANANLLTERFQATSKDRTVSWLPLFHDMGLMLGLIWPVVAGASSVLLRPSAFARRPVTWPKALSIYGGSISAAPNFGYQDCVDRIPAEELAGLDLGAWRVAICGAEPIRPDTVESFARRFEPLGFDRRSLFPSYGLAEATLFVSGGPRADGPRVLQVDRTILEKEARVAVPAQDGKARTLVSCGQAGPGVEIAIADPTSGMRLPEGQVGEVWVRGPSVGAGYLGLPEVSAEVFAAKLKTAQGDCADPLPAFYLRTGDRGFIQGGDLFIVGRLKDLIIVRGVNYAPHDIELTCSRSHPALEGGNGVAFAVDGEHQEEIVVVHELQRDFRGDASVVIGAIRDQVAQTHGLLLGSIALLPHKSLLLTTSGKVRRQPTREAWLRGEIALTAAWPTTVSAKGATAEQLELLEGS